MSVTPCPDTGGVARYSPWAEARSLEHVSIRLAELPAETGGAAVARRGERVWIFIDRGATQAERRALLTHELVHLSRGQTARCDAMPTTWDGEVVQEEQLVHREVARLLVPLDDLTAYVERTVDLGEPVHAAAVAEEFGTTIDVANRALWLLEQRRNP